MSQKNPGKMGRPPVAAIKSSRKVIKESELRKLMQLKPELNWIAGYYRVSPDTIERLIRKKWDLTFAEFRDQNMAEIRFGLVQKALDMAANGDKTMLIFALQNLCGWKNNMARPNPGGFGSGAHDVEFGF